MCLHSGDICTYPCLSLWQLDQPSPLPADHVPCCLLHHLHTTKTMHLCVLSAGSAATTTTLFPTHTDRLTYAVPASSPAPLKPVPQSPHTSPYILPPTQPPVVRTFLATNQVCRHITRFPTYFHTASHTHLLGNQVCRLLVRPQEGKVVKHPRVYHLPCVQKV